MTLLEVYNQCLAAIGESALSDLSTAAYEKAEIGPFIDRARKSILSIGWKCNMDTRTLTPTNNNEIVKPSNHLRYIFPTNLNYLTTRVNSSTGNKAVYDPSTSSFYNSEITGVVVVLDIDIDELPEVLAEAIAAEAALALLESIDTPEMYQVYLRRRNLAKTKAVNSQEVTVTGGIGLSALRGAFIR